MDPTGIGTSATIGGIVSLLVAFAAWLKYRRSKRERLGQAQADELKSGIERADSGNDPPLKLRVDKRGP